MSHSVKRAKSKNEQFRMAVPPDIRPLVGKVEWTASLDTTDRVAAAAKRGELIAFYKGGAGARSDPGGADRACCCAAMGAAAISAVATIARRAAFLFFMPLLFAQQATRRR
jgi:hypothetical protein